MGLRGARSLPQREFERYLHTSHPFKLRLIRANAFTCVGGLCFLNGRKSLSGQCPVCAGSGYIGVSRNVNGNLIVTATGAPYDDTMPPASITYFISGDLQTGHGLYGSGGDFLKLLADLGKQDVGDATLFSLMYDKDHATGQVIYPIVDPNLTRPDRIISRDGNVYNVVRQMIIDDGAIRICRSFTLEAGTFTSTGASGR